MRCRCKAVSLDEAKLFNGNVYSSGVYLVRKEIPAGEYHLIANAGTRGYWSIERFYDYVN